MEDPHEFKYTYNYSLFDSIHSDGYEEEKSTVVVFLECFIEKLKEILKADISCTNAVDTHTLHLVTTFICRVLPPYHPFVLYNEGEDTSRLRLLLDDASRNMLSVLDRIKDSPNASALGLDDPQFTMNIFNLYWRNNESIINDLVLSSRLLTPNYMRQLSGLVKPLLENIQKEYDYLYFLISSLKQGRRTETYRTFDKRGYFTCRSDTSSNFDRSALFVSKDTMLLDLLAILETLLRYLPNDEYENVLSASVNTSDGESQISTVLTSTYYLLAQAQKYLATQRAPLYKMEHFTDSYTAMFQRCLFYRCRMFALSCLLTTVKYNVILYPSDSADYCYNWLLVFLEIGGNEYEVDRSVILDDLREIDFLDHVDEWHSLSGTWIPGEIQQLKAMVPSEVPNTPIKSNDDIELIKEITNIKDIAAIKACLERHNFDVSETIMELVNVQGNESIPPRMNQPGKSTTTNADMSFHFVSKETRQAVLNYWDFINRPEIYDDDYDDNDFMEDSIMPLNARIVYEEMTDSDYDEIDAVSQEVSSDVADAAVTKETKRQDGPSTAMRKGPGSTSTRGSKGHKKYNRKRNTINLDAFG
ncbi:hypothetical protein BaOVIS_001440 [Babesia ovis]|uniref:Uncharacterized protein n=1 Tax=Babesia ovis TaxID=5869 RepID=A0A9W5WTD2_BABOV|nr:hypothetical protein BaOVIS_001440 [Babesia ovis]